METERDEWKIENGIVVSAPAFLDTGAELPAGVTGIAKEAFKGSFLHDLKIPAGLRDVGARAFQNCEILKEVEFPSGLEHIGESAFEGCKALKRVVLPETLREMASNAFFGCKELKEVVISPDNPFWCQAGNLLWRRDGTNLIWIPGSPEKTCAVPDGITALPARCFSGSKLEEIILPDSVTEIRTRAMGSCSKLASVRLPSGLRRVEGAAFSGCRMLWKLEIPDTLEELGNSAFAFTGLSDVVLPAGLRVLGTNVFRDSFLEKLVVLGELPEGWKTFSLADLGIQEYEDFELRADRIPMKKVARRTQPFLLEDFLRRWSAGETIPEETRKDRLDFIRRRQASLRKDPRVRTILLDEKLIGPGDIDGFLSEALAENNPELVARLLEYQEKHISREEKTRLEEKKVQQDMKALTRKEPTMAELKRLWPGCALKDGSWEIRGYGGAADSAQPVDELIVPASLKKLPVTALGVGAFSPEVRGRRQVLRDFLNGVKVIRVPEGVKVIEEAAFYCCASLEYVELPEGLEKIGNSAFAGCGKLKSVRLPKSLRSIGEEAFRLCRSLNEVEVEPGIRLKSMGQGAFSECGKLERIGRLTGLKELESGAFWQCSSLTSFPVPPQLKRVGLLAFTGCTSLEEIDLSGVDSLVVRAFAGCTALRRVTLSPHLTELPADVFLGCRALETIVLPDSLQRIGRNAIEQNIAGCVVASPGSYGYNWALKRGMKVQAAGPARDAGERRRTCQEQ